MSRIGCRIGGDPSQPTPSVLNMRLRGARDPPMRADPAVHSPRLPDRLPRHFECTAEAPWPQREPQARARRNPRPRSPLARRNCWFWFRPRLQRNVNRPTTRRVHVSFTAGAQAKFSGSRARKKRRRPVGDNEGGQCEQVSMLRSRQRFILAAGLQVGPGGVPQGAPGRWAGPQAAKVRSAPKGDTGPAGPRGSAGLTWPQGNGRRPKGRNRTGKAQPGQRARKGERGAQASRAPRAEYGRRDPAWVPWFRASAEPAWWFAVPKGEPRARRFQPYRGQISATKG